jgi:hypothetical protein
MFGSHRRLQPGVWQIHLADVSGWFSVVFASLSYTTGIPGRIPLED